MKNYGIHLAITELDPITGSEAGRLFGFDSPKLPLANAKKLLPLAIESVEDYEKAVQRKANIRPRDKKGHFIKPEMTEE